MHNLHMCVCMCVGGATVQVKELNLLARRDENKWSQTS